MEMGFSDSVRKIPEKLSAQNVKWTSSDFGGLTFIPMALRRWAVYFFRGLPRASEK